MSAVIEKWDVRVQPTGAALAADIEGIDLSAPLPSEALAAIKQAWARILFSVSEIRSSRMTI